MRTWRGVFAVWRGAPRGRRRAELAMLFLGGRGRGLAVKLGAGRRCVTGRGNAVLAAKEDWF